MNATMKTIELFIDGAPVSVAEGATIMDACAAAGVAIPSLCHMKGVSSNASCGICVVEVEGAKSLVRSCVQAAAPGMKVRSASRACSKPGARSLNSSWPTTQTTASLAYGTVAASCRLCRSAWAFGVKPTRASGRPPPSTPWAGHSPR